MEKSTWNLKEDMAKKNKFLGCYRRVLIFLLVVVTIILVPSGYIYQRSGGGSGLRYWMAGHTINVVEGHFLNNHPDSLSVDQIRNQFDLIREASSQREINLKQLYQILDSYQRRFQNTRPSIDQANQFMRDLGLTVFSDESIR
ncbi:MAG: hypothetical protein VYE00_03180 [Candidatus Poribacteria bacterium]|nr:hypothetical protein [Candidatus Poribacteria bacterium]